jgi:hypothetical protein
MFRVVRALHMVVFEGEDSVVVCVCVCVCVFMQIVKAVV